MNNFPVVTLNVQHRMRPEISRFVSKHIYEDKLVDSPSVHDYDDVKGMKYNVFFIDHREHETKDEENMSPSNEHEADFVVALANYLLKNGHKPEEITIITPYLGQMFLIRSHQQLNSKIHVSTIDNYQGEENEIILLSMVRSNEENKIGFTGDSNRVCVALSRAKIGFYCIGNFSMFRNKVGKRFELWNSIVSDLEDLDTLCLGAMLPLQCKTHKKVTKVSCAQDFLKISSGGCEQICRKRFPQCGHVCYRLCHPKDLDHKFPCTQPCPRRCAQDLHRCKGTCGSPCPPCKELTKKELPRCGHVQEVPCNLSPLEYSCQEKCTKILPCGHSCKLTCGEKCDSKHCRMFVTKVWPCGHEAQKECHVSELEYSFSCSFSCDAILTCTHKCSGKCGKCCQGRLHAPCEQKCGQTLICGHVCSQPCATNCPPCEKECQFRCPHANCDHQCSEPCIPCAQHCNWKCEHYQCTRNCGEICDRPRCSEPCKEELKCGHPCIGVCGEPCPKICRICDKDSDVFEIFFGTEDEPESHFIELGDCEHVFEVNSLDEWVDNESESTNIDWKRCPRCKKPIVTTLRYANETQKILQDMNTVKKKMWFERLSNTTRKEYIKGSLKLCEEIQQMLQYIYVSHSMNRRALSRWFSTVRHTVDKVSDFNLENILAALQCISKALDIISKLEEYSRHQEVNNPLYEKVKVLSSQTTKYLDWIVLCLKRLPFTEQMLNDLQSERRRLTLLAELYLYHYTHPGTVSLDQEVVKKIQHYQCLGTKPETVSQDVFEEAMKIFNAPLTENERKMIIKALGAKSGSWYKCPNGHYYQIGQCGGAMQTSKCPECSAEIGGTNHALTQGNQHAGEFDGSRHAAWSEGANLANYEGIH